MGAVAPTLIGFGVAGRSLVAGDWSIAGTWRILELAEYVFGQRVDLIRVLAIFVWSATLLGGIAAVVIRWLVGTTPEGK
jgi:cell division protein FtsX